MKDQFDFRETFSQCYIFSAFDESDYQSVNELVQWHSFSSGQYLFHEGDACNGFFLVCSGNVDIVKQYPEQPTEEILVTLSKGEIFGEIALFLADGRRSASAKGNIQGVYCFFPKEAFDKMLRDDSKVTHKIVLAMARTLSERLDHITKKSIKLTERDSLVNQENHDLLKFKDQLASLWSF